MVFSRQRWPMGQCLCGRAPSKIEDVQACSALDLYPARSKGWMIGRQRIWLPCWLIVVLRMHRKSTFIPFQHTLRIGAKNYLCTYRTIITYCTAVQYCILTRSTTVWRYWYHYDYCWSYFAQLVVVVTIILLLLLLVRRWIYYIICLKELLAQYSVLLATSSSRIVLHDIY